MKEIADNIAKRRGNRGEADRAGGMDEVELWRNDAAVFENGSSYQRKRKYKGEKAAQTADRPGDGGKTASLLSGKESESEGASDGGAS